MKEHEGFTIQLRHLRDLEFYVKFDWEQPPELLLDEPEPLGHEQGPNATRLLAAAVGNCLAASLLFCLKKSRVDGTGLTARVSAEMERNEQRRLRVGRMAVTIELPKPLAGEQQALQRCLGLFEDYCVVTASVRRGIPIRVEVRDAAGTTLLDTESSAES